MRATLKILLCDDFEDRGNDAVRAIRRLADSHPGALPLEIDGLYADELQRELESLFDNARRILDHDYTLGLPNLQDPPQTRLGSADLRYRHTRQQPQSAALQRNRGLQLTTSPATFEPLPQYPM